MVSMRSIARAYTALDPGVDSRVYDRRMHTFTLALAAASAIAASTAQDPPHAMPPGMTHEEHLKQLQKDADLKKRGAAAMGFDQETTAHHFLLLPDGGAIEVSV